MGVQVGGDRESVERLAVISDVHGNLSALEAVLADIADRGITRILNLGDHAGKGPRGAAVVDLVARVCEVNVRGNWDDFLPYKSGSDSPGIRWWHDELGPERLAWGAAQPLSHDLLLSGRRVRLFHASAASVHRRVHSPRNRQTHRTDEEFAGMFAATELTGDGPEPTVVGYGDVHDAYLEVNGGRTLFNAGSVGNPLDEPVPVYAILEGVPGSAEPAPFGISHVRVPYDVETEIAVAHDLGMPEADLWEAELRTARYRGTKA